MRHSLPKPAQHRHKKNALRRPPKHQSPSLNTKKSTERQNPKPKIKAKRPRKLRHRNKAIQVLDYDTNAARGRSAHSEVEDTLAKRAHEHPLPPDQFIKHFRMYDPHAKQELDHFHMIQIELPRANKIRKLFPRNKKKKPDFAYFKQFTEQDWFLSILRHAEDYTPKLLEKLHKKQCIKNTFVDQMLKTLTHANWKPPIKFSYAKDSKIFVELFEVPLALAEDKDRRKGIKKGIKEGLKVGREEARKQERATQLRHVADLVHQKHLTLAVAQQAFQFTDKEMRKLRKKLKKKGAEASQPRTSTTEE